MKAQQGQHDDGSLERYVQRPAAQPSTQVLVWDAPVRVFHWLMAASFLGAWLSAESERWALVHISLGYTMGGLVLFRLVWGGVGTRHACFRTFVRGPRAVRRYLASLLLGQPEHHIGHNPAGAVAIVALLGLTAVTALSGWAAHVDWGGEWVGEVHEVAAHLMFSVVLVHVAGVMASSWLHHENLVLSMFNGRKAGSAADGIRSAWYSLAVLMLAAVLAFWWLQWRAVPASAPQARTAASAPAEKSPPHSGRRNVEHR
jgi:cytochrome b